MTWHGIQGHDPVVDRFGRALRRGRLASSFLFAGPPGVGKRTLAVKLAQALLCPVHPEEDLDPCGKCPSCVQVQAGTHPDLELVAKPPDRAFLPLELFLGDKEHRMREGLCHTIGLKPYLGGRKVAIIDDADYLNPEGANCLLKTLEEPPPRSVLILVTTSPAKQLPTIRSRCQLVRFLPLPPTVVADLLVTAGVAGPEAAMELAEASGGSVQKAMELADQALAAFRSRFLGQLAGRPFDPLRLAKFTWDFVQQAGKEASTRRNRMRQVVELSIEFFRGLLRRLAAGPTPGTEQDGPRGAELPSSWRLSPDAACRSLQRCIDAHQQLDRNVNLATFLECWLHDLAEIEHHPG